MNPGFPADFTDEPDDSEYVAEGIIEIEEKPCAIRSHEEAAD
jgi:hypothetical protein